MADISIIIPLFNAGKYLEEALQSVLRQTFGSFEIICVNDASTDTTMEILKKYRKKDDRIIILSNQERSGAAVSRNKGLQYAKGKYVTFLDGDDLFDEEMLQLAFNAMEKDNVDVVIYEYKHFFGDRIYEKNLVSRGNRFIDSYCKTPFSMRQCSPIEFMNFSSSPCNKLYRKSFIYDNKLEFQTLSSANDVYFVDMALLLSEKIIMLKDRRVMVYARDHFEPTRISFDRDPMCVYLAMKKIEEELIARELFPEVFEHFYYRLVYNLIGAILKTKENEKAQSFYRFIQEEGMKTVFTLDGIYYKELDNYISDLLNDFLHRDFLSGWYKNENTLACYLNQNVEKVISLLQSFADKGSQIAIWGVGVNGKTLIDFLERHQLKVAEVVDRDEKKWGKIINGYIVKNPAAILGEIQVVMVSTYFVLEEIQAELSGKNIQVIDIGEVIGKD